MGESDLLWILNIQIANFQIELRFRALIFTISEYTCTDPCIVLMKQKIFSSPNAVAFASTQCQFTKKIGVIFASNRATFSKVIDKNETSNIP